jgi:multidrug efflux system membrane fusion protein
MFIPKKSNKINLMKQFNKHTLFFFSLLWLTACQEAPPPEKPPHLVSVVKPLVRDVPVYIDYIGHIVAKTSVTVMSQVSGNIVAQYFVEGQEVKQGDLLLVIDPRPFEATLAKAEATVAQTYATLHYDKETTFRYGPLVKQDFISQLNYDQYVTNVIVDEAVIAQNKADLETAKINLGYCYIEAPMDCVTGKLQVKTGNYVDANSGTDLVLLNQIQPILVDFDVPETDLLTIQELQQKAMLKLIVYPDPAHKHSFAGKLTLIDNQVNTATGTVLMEGTLPNEEKLLWPGHFVDVRLILEEKKGALLLPNDAVMNGQKGHYVYVVKSDSSIAVKTVKIGQRYDDSYVCIESGIGPHEQVVTEGQLNLFPGTKVQIQPTETARRN